MVDVSIIVPVYNVECYLHKAIDSILAQSYKNFELILVNDGSKDKSGLICDEYRKIDERVEVIHQDNMGTGFARNAGLDVAKGEYIYFSDPDDYIEKDLIKDNIKIAKQNNANLVIFGYYNEVIKKNKIETTEVQMKYNNLNTKEEFRMYFKNEYNSSLDVLWNKIYKHEYLKKNNCRFTRQKVGQDALFNLITYREMEGVIFNQFSYYHYVSRNNSAVNQFKEKRFEYEYNIAKEFNELIKYWNNYDDYIQEYALVNLKYWAALFLELRNLCGNNCPYNLNEKVNRLMYCTSVTEIETTIVNYNPLIDKLVFSKVLKYLFKKNYFRITIYIMSLRILLEKKQSRLFRIFKKKLTCYIK